MNFRVRVNDPLRHILSGEGGEGNAGKEYQRRRLGSAVDVLLRCQL